MQLTADMCAARLGESHGAISGNPALKAIAVGYTKQFPEPPPKKEPRIKWI